MLNPDDHYWLNNYGHCELDSPKCICLKTGWKGQTCPNWIPLGVKSYEEFKAYIVKTKTRKVVT
jgi:hypothetical protein